MSNLLFVLLYQRFKQLLQFCSSFYSNLKPTASTVLAIIAVFFYKVRTHARRIKGVFPYIVFQNNCYNCYNCSNIRISTVFRIAIQKIIANNCYFPTHSTLSALFLGVKN